MVFVNQTAYAYDSWGNVAAVWQSHDGAAVTTGENESPHVHYAYDDGSPSGGEAPHLRLSSVTYPDGRTVYYNYGAAAGTDDVLSLLADIADGTGTNRVKYAAYTYLGAGTVVQVDHPALDSVGGLRLTYKGATDGVYSGFDRFGRVVAQVWTVDGDAVDSYGYTYDRNSNRLTRSNDLNTDLSEAYSYDGLDRLVGADRDGANLQDWGLDSLGNWGTFTEGSTTQDRTHNAGNEIQTVEGWAGPTYDDAGNMTSGPVPGSETARQHYRYDAWNRLVAVYADDTENPGQPGDLVAAYTYDGLGQRIQRTVDTTTDDYYYNETGQVVEVRRGGDVHPLEQYVWDIRHVDAPVVRFYDGNTDGDLTGGAAEGDSVLYYTTDANFSVTALVDAATGAVVERYVYSPYGAVSVLSGARDQQGNATTEWQSRAATLFDNQVLYSGYRLDSVTGLYHTDAREYDAYMGRFVQVDPMGLAAGPNVYAYCDGWPTGATDPMGLDPDWAKAGAGIMMFAFGVIEVESSLPMVNTATSISGTVLGYAGLTAGFAGMATGEAMVLAAFTGNAQYDQTAQAASTVQLVAGVPALASGLTRLGGSLLRRGEGVLKDLLEPTGPSGGGNRLAPGNPAPEVPVPNAPAPNSASEVPGVPGSGGPRKLTPDAARDLPGGRTARVPVNRVGARYPRVVDPRTGKSVPFPEGNLKPVPEGQRVPWGLKERGEFIAEWYQRGYKEPVGGWARYDIHHIKPREYGGTNTFDNLVPVLRGTHQEQFNSFWRDF